MMRNALISKLILTIVVLGFLFAGQPIRAVSPLKSERVENQEAAWSDDSKVVTGGQVTVQLSRADVDTIVAALPESDARRIFKEKLATGAEKDNAASDEVPKEGEEFGDFVFEVEKAYSRVQERIFSFFTKPTSTFDSHEWAAALDNINKGEGLGHFILTYFIAALLILAGLAIEWLVRRSTENLRRQILDTASLGRLHFLGRVLSRLLLNMLGLGTYMLTTFVLFATFYDVGDPGYSIVFGTLVPSYYVRFFILAANLVLSPAAPALRLFPLQNEDAKFLYRWTIIIVVTGIIIADISYLFEAAGISQENFLLLYSMSGLSVSLLVVVMIWHSRRRVARAIWPGDPAGDEAKTSLRAGIAGSWHWFVMLYVIGIGVFWFIRGLAKGEVAIVPQLTSLFLIPIFIGLSRWAERLLDIASGLSPPSFAPQNTGSPETTGDHEAIQSEETDEQKAGTKSYLQQHLALIKRILRILLGALMFFVILRLWGIDLPVGRMFTSTALNIIGLVLLGFVVWQFITARIDKRLREEMPDDDEEMEEGGRGGSRIGTLLVLLRKFILSVLFVIVSLIILSSLGVNIGPLIAGAGVIGLAIGFGSQTLVRDILSGVFFLIDDAFRVGDYIETGGIKGMVQHISLRSVKLRHPRGMVFTIPFGDMGAVQNFSRDYIITKLDVRVRYDADVDKIRKIVKKIGKELEQHEEIGPVLLSPIKSQGVREMDDSAMILRVKFKTPPGEQFVVRREVYRLIQERFREHGIEFAHRNVTVYLPPEASQTTSGEEQDKGTKTAGAPGKKLIEAGAAAGIAAALVDEDAKKPKGQ
jgi:small-conductance mechanosensitive channel